MFWFDFNWQIQTFLNQFYLELNFLLLVILVVLGYLSYKKPIYAAAGTIILLPTYLVRSQIWFIPITFLELCILITFFGWLIKTKPYKSKLSLKNYGWPILLVLFGASVAVLIAPDKIAATGLWKAYFIEPILFFLVLTDVAKLPENKKIILWALGIGSLIISLLAIYQKFTAFGIAQPIWIGQSRRRTTSIFSSPNAVGLYLGPIVAIYLPWLLGEWKNYKATICKIIILAAAVLAIIFSVSAGALVGLVGALVFIIFVLIWPKIKNWKDQLNKPILPAIILAAVLIILVGSIFGNKILSSKINGLSGQNRLVLWQMSEKYLIASPKNFVLGAGILGFAKFQNEQRDPLKMEPLLYPHNILLNFWLEIGLVGLAGLVWLIILFFKNAKKDWRQFKWLKLGLMAAMITIIIHGLVDVPYFKNDLAVLFWLIVSLI
ncbi:MAG: O-antigen ligase family protein [Candidatus Buchananbacteria bacterium]